MFQLHSSPGNQALCQRHPKNFSLAQDLSAYDRALGELAMDPKLRDLSREAPMRERALMLDRSRNALYRLNFLMDRLLPDPALMGYNAFCLYTEDTY
jgi:hypothetical protein